MRKFAATVAAATLVLLPTAAAAQTTAGAEIVVVHGVPGLEVDVLVDGAAATDTTTPILSTTSVLGAGIRASIIAYLDADGAPQLRRRRAVLQPSRRAARRDDVRVRDAREHR